MASSSDLYIPGVTTVPFQCTPGPREEVIATVLRKLFAGLSVLGSGFIIATLVQKWRRSPHTIDPYCRIMLYLSVYDIIWSFFPWFLGSWLMPAETGHWGASGNTQTCTLQGFFFWLGVPGAQYYQILLSLHTLLLVTFRWTTREFHERIERYAHAVIFGVAITLATIPLFLGGYNPECGTCLPAPLPIWCGDWIFWGDGKTECLRGSPMLSQSYYTIYLTNLSIMGVFCTYAMIQVYCSVRKQEDRNLRYASFQASASHRQKSKRIRRTMILYTFGFYLCWIVPSFIIHFAQQGTALMRMSYILLPFQGWFNMIIFLAPKCARYQNDHPGTWLIMAYAHVLFDSCTVAVVSGPVQAIRRSSSRFSNPFRLSSRSGTLGQTRATELETIEVWEDDDDGIGFNGFNEEPTRLLVRSGHGAGAQATEDDPYASKEIGPWDDDDNNKDLRNHRMNSFRRESSRMVTVAEGDKEDDSSRASFVEDISQKPVTLGQEEEEERDDNGMADSSNGENQIRNNAASAAAASIDVTNPEPSIVQPTDPVVQIQEEEEQEEEEEEEEEEKEQEELEKEGLVVVEETLEEDAVGDYTT